MKTKVLLKKSERAKHHKKPFMWSKCSFCHEIVNRFFIHEKYFRQKINVQITMEIIIIKNLAPQDRFEYDIQNCFLNKINWKMKREANT